MARMLRGKTVLLAGGTAELPAALASGLMAAGARVRLPSRDGRVANEEVEALYSAAGRIDILINIVPPVPPAAFFDMSRGAWGGLLSSTLDDAFLWTQAVARVMSFSGEQGGIINIVGNMDHPDADVAPFTELASRGIVVALTRALAAELANRGIQVNAIVGRSARGPGSGEAGFADVVRTAVFLCAAQGTFVSGETIEVGGSAA